MKCSRERERRQHRGRGGGPGPRNLLTPPGAAPPPARCRPPCRAQGPRAAPKPGCLASASAPDAQLLRHPRPGPPPASQPPRNLDNRGPALQSAGWEGGGSEAPAGARVPGGRGRGDLGGGSPATLSLRAPGRLHSFPGGAGNRLVQAASRGQRASPPPSAGAGAGAGTSWAGPPLTPVGQGPRIVLLAKERFPVYRTQDRKAFHVRVLQTLYKEPLPLLPLSPKCAQPAAGLQPPPLYWAGTLGWGPSSTAPPAVNRAVSPACGMPGHRGGVTT